MRTWLAVVLLASVPATGCAAAAITTAVVGAGVATAGAVTMPRHCDSEGCAYQQSLDIALIGVGAVLMLVGGGVYAAEKL